MDPKCYFTFNPTKPWSKQKAGSPQAEHVAVMPPQQIGLILAAGFQTHSESEKKKPKVCFHENHVSSEKLNCLP